MEWAESSFADRVSYDSEVTRIGLPPEGTAGPSQYPQIEIRNGTGTRLAYARNVAISTGLVAHMPIAP